VVKAIEREAEQGLWSEVMLLDRGRMLGCHEGIHIASLAHLRARGDEVGENLGVEHVLGRTVLPVQYLEVLLGELGLLQVVLLMELGEV